MNTIVAIRRASEEAKKDKQWAFRQYRMAMFHKGAYPEMRIVKDLYRLGTLPPVFPLPVPVSDWQHINCLTWFSNHDGFWNND